MKTEELIYRIQDLYSQGVASDDTALSNRLVYNKLLTVRARILAEEAKSGKFLTDWNTQTLPCVELIEAPIHECPCTPPLSCIILRTKEKLPRPVSLDFGSSITSVTSLDGSVIYSPVEWNAKKYRSGSRYTSKMPDYFVKNQHLYITWYKGPKVISITGLFEDPIKVEEYPSYCGNNERSPCWSPLEMDFPMEDKYLDILVQECLKELVVLFRSGTSDKQNNGKDDTIPLSQHGA